MNCLVHVPHAESSTVVTEVSRILKSTGRFYLGQYGGYEHEGALVADPYEPKRFFAVHTEPMRGCASSSPRRSMCTPSALPPARLGRPALPVVHPAEAVNRSNQRESTARVVTFRLHPGHRDHSR